MDLFKLVAKLGMDSSEYEKGIAKARGSFSDLGNSIGAKAVAIGNMVSRAVEKAVDIAADLGRSAIQNAADVTAEKAQYKATFKELQGEADAAFKNIEKDTGVFGTRLKNVGTKAFSQFKGAGLDGVEALGMMEEYTKLAADAAAYYDISLEDAGARLRSFLRGNTEAGDAIGLFTSESQRNSAAMEKYGQKWQNLNEAQKQMLMLDISKDIYEQSGAIGQAARESDSWTNIVGNLKEVWRQASALIGAPIISALTPVIQEITGFLQDEGVQTKFTQFGLTIGTIASKTFDGAMEFIDKMNTTGTGENTLMTGIGGFAESLKKIAESVLDNVTDFLELLIGGPDGMSDTIENIGTFFEDIGTFITTYEGPISTLIGVIMAFWAVQNPFKLLLAALGLLITNWKDVKEWTSNTLTKTRIFFQTQYQDKISPILETIAGWFGTVWQAITDAATALTNFLGIKIDKSITGGTDYDPEVPTVSGGMGDYSQGWGSDYSFEPTGSAGGLYYAKNNYVAKLHEGEAILNSRQATAWRADQGGNNAELLAEIRELRSALMTRREVMTPDGRVIGEISYETVSQKIAQDARGRRYSFG